VGDNNGLFQVLRNPAAGCGLQHIPVLNIDNTSIVQFNPIHLESIMHSNPGQRHSEPRAEPMVLPAVPYPAWQLRRCILMGGWDCHFKNLPPLQGSYTPCIQGPSVKSLAPGWSGKLNFEGCPQFVLHNWTEVVIFINILSSFPPTYPPLITFIKKIPVANVASSSRCTEFNFNWDKVISSVQTAAPGQQLRYQSPEASHHLSRHCVHTTLFLPHDTLQTMQHAAWALNI